MTDPTAIHLSDLPETARDMAEVIGLAAAIRVVERFGGVRLWFGRRGPSDELVAAVGLEAAQALCDHYGAEVVAVPRAADALRTARDREMLAAVNDGATHRQMALRYGLTERAVIDALKRARQGRPPSPKAAPADNRQATLF